MLPNFGILFKDDATYSCIRAEAFVVVRPMETQASISKHQPLSPVITNLYHFHADIYL
jgi:hypothetical protein